jgi:hypothetical protein
MPHRLRWALVAGLLATTTAPVQAQLVGAPATGGNCFPFSCVLGASTRYQQVYAASNFAGPLTIMGIDFFTSHAGNLNSGTFNFFLSTTTAPVNGLSTDMATNVGADQQLFGSFVLAGGPSPATLSFTGAGFSYNPALGNLLLDIQITGITGGSAYMQSRNGDAGGAFSRMHDFGSGFEDWGLVTEFHGAQTVVPEPATMLLLGSGLLGLATLRHRRRRTGSHQA